MFLPYFFGVFIGSLNSIFVYREYYTKCELLEKEIEKYKQNQSIIEIYKKRIYDQKNI
jgi:hypothetical protein